MLRTIEFGKWENWEYPWLEDGDLPADPFWDFKTRHNALSVWEVGEDESLIGRVAAATTVKRRSANKQSVRKFEYILFDSDVLSDLQIDQIKERGDTFDSGLDTSSHFNLVHLSGRRLHKLIDRIRTLGEAKRIQRKDVLRHIRTSFENGHILEEALPPDALNKLKGELSLLE